MRPFSNLQRLLTMDLYRIMVVFGPPSIAIWDLLSPADARRMMLVSTPMYRAYFRHLRDINAPAMGLDTPLRIIAVLRRTRCLQTLSLATLPATRIQMDAILHSFSGGALTSLNLSKTAVDDLSFLTRFRLLRHLKLFRCVNVIDLGPISSCHDLRYLDVTGARALHLPSFTRCPQL